jgi:hypothetical protein
MADEEPGTRTSGTGIARSELRASHEDRDRIVELLRVSAGDGRLTAEELDQRLEAALGARTYGELAALVADLPASGAVGVPAAGLTATPKELVRIDCRSGNAKRVGQWVVPQRMEVRVTSGNVVLDLTQAVFPQPLVRIDAEVRSGNLRLITKPGIVVDADEVAVHSGNVRVKAPWGHDVPEIFRVEVSGKVGSGNIVAGPPYRTFWQWLTRKPKPYAMVER